MTLEQEMKVEESYEGLPIQQRQQKDNKIEKMFSLGLGVGWMSRWKG